MTPSELKYHVEATGSKFFSHRTMRFFGDTMRNFAVFDAGGQWGLRRKKPVKNGLRETHYFDKLTFKEVRDNELVR